MTPDHTDQPKEPAPVAGCFGMCCDKHETCKLYYAVNGLTTGRVIDTCGIGVYKPKYKSANVKVTGAAPEEG